MVEDYFPYLRRRRGCENKICFFSGVPIDDAATMHRAGLLAKKLNAKGREVIFTSVSANFKKEGNREVGDLSVLFIGQAHYRAWKPFSTRQRLWLGKVFWNNLGICFRFSKMLRREKPGVVLLVTAMPSSLMVGVVAKILRYKTVIDIEDLALGQMESSGYPKFLVKIYSFWEKLCLRFFDKIVVCSQYLHKRYSGSIIIPNMIEPFFWVKRRKREKNIVFVGQMGAYHGQMEVLRVFSNFLKTNPDWKLIFVGGGENLSKLKFKIDNLKLENQVIMMGQLPQKNVGKILAVATFGLLPLWDIPVHRARHPLKLLEYLASGLVVVSSRVGEAERIITDGENGFLCPEGDMRCMTEKVEAVLKNHSLAEKIGKKAVSSAEQFSVERILPKWRKVLAI